MMVTRNIENYLDANAHREHMRRNTFYGYSRAEVDGNYVHAMYCQLLMPITFGAEVATVFQLEK